MSKEIFTTDNMNEIVTPIYEAMEAGNPVAKLVFDLNDAINALKPGRPISKAERDRIEFMWDNLLVGLANESIGADDKGIAAVVGEAAKSEGILFDANCIESVLLKWHKAYKDMTTKAEENKEEGYSDASKLVILDGLTNMLKTKGTKAIAEALEISEELIIEVIRRSEGAEDKFFEELKPENSLVCVAESNYTNDNDEDDDQDKNAEDDAKELEQKFMDALKKVFGNIDTIKCKAGCCNRPKPVMVKVSKGDEIIISEINAVINKMFEAIM